MKRRKRQEGAGSGRAPGRERRRQGGRCRAPPVHGAVVRRVQLLLVLVLLAIHAVVALVVGLVHVAALPHAAQQRLHHRLVAGVGRAHEGVVADVQLRCRRGAQEEGGGRRVSRCGARRRATAAAAGGGQGAGGAARVGGVQDAPVPRGTCRRPRCRRSAAAASCRAPPPPARSSRRARPCPSRSARPCRAVGCSAPARRRRWWGRRSPCAAEHSRSKAAW